MNSNFSFHLPLLLLAALLLAACGGETETPAQAEAPAEEPTAITVSMNDIYFGDTNDNVATPPIWTVLSGAEVTVQVENMGALEHNWAVLKADEEIPAAFDESADADKLLIESGVIAAGAESSFTFTAPESGEFNVICTIPGHTTLMQGRLVIEG